ncbi:MAG: hypothetical protein A2V86_11120 [Deltaproteobacteria bacterium RBG_16_49_23]|nr:MAG: hypothetical protein A2V86_11120 [Deltaproteobacteria bacterium RBG_16_49_23]
MYRKSGIMECWYQFSCLKSSCKIPPLPSPKRLRAGRQPPFTPPFVGIKRPKGGEIYPPFDKGGLDNLFQSAKVLRILKCWEKFIKSGSKKKGQFII